MHLWDPGEHPKQAWEMWLIKDGFGKQERVNKRGRKIL